MGEKVYDNFNDWQVDNFGQCGCKSCQEELWEAARKDLTNRIERAARILKFQYDNAEFNSLYILKILEGKI